MAQPTVFFPACMSDPCQFEGKFGFPSLSRSVASYRLIVVMLMFLKGECDHAHHKVIKADEGLFSEKTTGSQQRFWDEYNKKHELDSPPQDDMKDR
eukprot:2782671-Ditylum_brightwellii.AAC.1